MNQLQVLTIFEEGTEAVLLVDAANLFNSVIREVFLNYVFAICPAIATLPVCLILAICKYPCQKVNHKEILLLWQFMQSQSYLNSDDN